MHMQFKKSKTKREENIPFLKEEKSPRDHLECSRILTHQSLGITDFSSKSILIFLQAFKSLRILKK